MTTGGTVSQVLTGFNYFSSITTGPDGNLWFTGFYQDEVGRLTPSGSAKLFPLATSTCALKQIASGAGALWVTCSESDFVYRVSRLGKHTAIGVPSHVANYPDDLYAIVGAPNGAVWFTEEAAARVGRITT